MTRETLRSFAFGLLFATLVLAGSYFISNASREDVPLLDEANQTKELSIEEIKNVVSKQGYKVITKEEYDQLQNSLKELEQKNKQSKDPNKSDEKKTEKTEEQIVKNIEIQPGMVSSQVAQLLKEQDIIDNAKQFQAYLDNNELNKYIQIGLFTLNNKMSYEEIANEITKR